MFMTDITQVYYLPQLPMSVPSQAQQPLSVSQNEQNPQSFQIPVISQQILNLSNSLELDDSSEKPPGYVDLQDAVNGIKQFVALLTGHKFEQEQSQISTQNAPSESQPIQNNTTKPILQQPCENISECASIQDFAENVGNTEGLPAPQITQNPQSFQIPVISQQILDLPNSLELDDSSEKPLGYVDIQDAIDGVKQFAALSGEALSAVRGKIAESGIKEKAADAASDFKDSTGQVLDAVRQMRRQARDKIKSANIKGKASDAAGDLLAFSADTVNSAKEKIAETSDNAKEKASTIGYFFRGLFELIAEKLHALFHHENEEADEDAFPVSPETSEKTATNKTVLVAVIAVVLAGGGVAAGLLLTKKKRQNPASVSMSSVAVTEQQKTANPAINAVSEAYTAVLRSFMRSAEFVYSGDGIECSKYDLADLNDDGIPELIISKYDYGSCALYTYANGQALCLIGNTYGGGTIYSIPNQQIVLDLYDDQGYADLKVYSFTQNEFRLLRFLEGAYPDNSGDTPPYFKINDVYVQQQNFEAECNRYLSNAQQFGRKYAFPANPEQLQLKAASN